MKTALHLLLVALVACGESRQQDPPTTTQPETPRAIQPAPPTTCKTGAHLCSGDDVVVCEDSKPGRTLTSCRGGCKLGACVDTCGANEVELIYVVSNDRTLLSFDPRKLPGDPFRKIGELTCGAGSPFSMAVDRTGVAWVVYHTGTLYQVSLLDAHCFAQAAPPEGAPLTFGMGFVSDGPKATTEKLYVAGESSSVLATIDTSVFPTTWKAIGKVVAKQERSPELTGTGEGRLYGYFPNADGRGFVQELDRSGTAIGKRWDLPAGRGRVNAWAFAFWGDVFYVFLTIESINEVHAIHRKTGKHEVVQKSSLHQVVGAGVSTCAPLLEKPL